jgi:hypothetical protein
VEELLLSMLDKSSAKRPSPAQVRAIIHELRGTPPPFDWDNATPSPVRVRTPTPSQPGAPAPSTLDVDPLPAPGRRRFIYVVAGVLLFGIGAGLLASLMAKRGGTERSQIAQPLSQPATVPSPAKTELPAPTTPAVANEGTLVIRVDATNARIELDGALVAQSASGARLRVGAGEHDLVVTAPGRRRYATRVGVASTGTVELPVHLHHDGEPASAAPPPAAKAAKPAESKKPREKRNDPDYLVDPFSGQK